MAETDVKSRSLRILALHGHRQSGDIFAKKTGSLKKILASAGVSFIHYPTAPHKLEEKNDEGEDVYSWFQWEPVANWLAPERYTGVEESIAVLRKAFHEHGPFDGVLGFSQGGVVASMLTGMRTPRDRTAAHSDAICFDFAIFASTFAPLVSDYFYYPLKSNTCAPLATLHVYGLADPLVVPEMSQKLAAEFEAQAAVQPTENSHESDIRIYKTSAMRLEHPGGHFVATTAAAKKTYRDFIDQWLLSRSSQS